MGFGDSAGSKFDSMLKTKLPALGIDLGGTKLSAAVVSDYALVTEAKQIATPTGAENILKAIQGLIEDFQKDHTLSGVGIATAGIVDCDNGEVIGSTGNLPGWAGTHIKRVIEGKILIPVHVENDANAAAYGEVASKRWENKECVIVVTLGTGIGGGIMMKGRLYRGAHWAAGEIGHMKISLDNKRYCTCGFFDCWEAYGSGRGLAETGKELAATVTADQSKLAEDIQNVTTQSILEAAAEGDLIAQKALNMWHKHVALGLVNLAQAFDPDCFILSGGMSQFVDYELLKELVVDHCLPRIGEKLEIQRSQLGVAAGIIGAAHIVLDQIMTNK